MKVDLPRIIAAQTVLLGVGFLWYNFTDAVVNFTKTVAETTDEIIQIIFSDQEMPDAESD